MLIFYYTKIYKFTLNSEKHQYQVPNTQYNLTDIVELANFRLVFQHIFHVSIPLSLHLANDLIDNIIHINALCLASDIQRDAMSQGRLGDIVDIFNRDVVTSV